jgi:glycosyltransferase involved in cell wall biosynthesis
VDRKPKLSIIVVCYRMAIQIRNTIHSLDPSYQRGVAESDYEVILVENSSDQQLRAGDIDLLPNNFRYVLREESSTSPAAAINEGFRLARGDFIGLMIDGAYLLTPGILKYALLSLRATSQAFVTVPTYHLGPEEQAVSVCQGYDVSVQEELLESINWTNNGYRLFQIGSLCLANPKGLFSSILESNCYFASRQAFDDIGYADESFQQPGGGSLNLHMTLKLGTRDGSVYFSLGGEGVFHQYHGGVTTSETRDEHLQRFDVELHEKWDGKFHYFARNPIVIGSFNQYAHDSLQKSSLLMQKRFRICEKNNWPVWEDEQPHDV